MQCQCSQIKILTSPKDDNPISFQQYNSPVTWLLGIQSLCIINPAKSYLFYIKKPFLMFSLVLNDDCAKKIHENNDNAIWGFDFGIIHPLTRGNIQVKKDAVELLTKT